MAAGVFIQMGRDRACFPALPGCNPDVFALSLGHERFFAGTRQPNAELRRSVAEDIMRLR